MCESVQLGILITSVWQGLNLASLIQIQIVIKTEHTSSTLTKTN